MQAGATMLDQYLGGLFGRNAGLSHEQQVVAKDTAGSSTAVLTNPAMTDIAAALTRLLGHVLPPQHRPKRPPSR